MKKKIIAISSLVIILSFIGYIIYDTASTKRELQKEEPTIMPPVYPEVWHLARIVPITDGKLTSVAVTSDGKIVLGGDSFVTLYDTLFSKKWNLKTSERISAVSVSGDTLFACTSSGVLLISKSGKNIAEWGPYEENSIITSVSAGKKRVAIADAGNKLVYMLDKGGEVTGMIGQGERKFIVPSPYFDVVLKDDDTLFVANTGNHRIEKWTTGGQFISEFGNPGVAPEEFNACCNPAHFALIPQGFVTAEKGLNRIKILDNKGSFTGFVSVKNNFSPPHPLDIASFKGKVIYAANEFDSKLYVFVPDEPK